ncbi:MAG: XTP/dITP diphosphatase [Phycisphaerales bacterium]|nr:MAG: XTP/dITP diphosphatase [Phycisphaerales bacterium]
MSCGFSRIEGRVIVIATRNAGKIREIRQILAHLPARWKTLDEFPELPDCEETGMTFADNARAKALYYSEATGHLALADDSGLEVDVLEGRPGVRSARYAGAGKDDAANNARLIGELAGIPAEQRTARFRCAAALAEKGRVLAEGDGSVEGRIIDEPRGHNGFGYDPHFLLPERGVTTAELDTAEKSRISHRGRALRALAAKLEELG